MRRTGNMLLTKNILLVSADKEPLYSELSNSLQNYGIGVNYTNLGTDGLALYEKYTPHMVLIDSHLDDMSGMSMASIIKKSQNGMHTKVILYNVEMVFNNTAADRFFNKSKDKEYNDDLKNYIINYYHNDLSNSQNSAEVLRLREQQYQMLPADIKTDSITVTGILSPYIEVGGDSFDYWLNENGDLYGELYDCRGHNLVSFSQVLMLHTLFKKDMKQYEKGIYDNLEEVMKSVNNDLFVTSAPEPDTTAAIVFHLDKANHKLKYCTAGMPGIFVRYDGKKELEAIESSNFLLGFDEDLEWDEQELDLHGIEQIVICSDGLYELTLCEKEVAESRNAKHDDVSAIIINLKNKDRKKERNFNE